jgi:hypothetical protein
MPDRAYIEKALRECPSCFGIAVQSKEGNTSSLEVFAESKNISVDKLMETLEACKDDHVVLTLGNMVQDFDDVEDLMPYVFQQGSAGGNDIENILAVFLEGDAPNYSKPGEGHTEMSNLWEDYIFPTVSEKYEASTDLPAFYNKLQTSSFQQSILNSFHHRGVAVFVPLFGDTICYGKNEIGGEFSWGTTSNTFGWEKDTETKTIVQKAKGKLAALTGGGKTETKVVVKPEEKTHTVISSDNKGMTVVKPPAKLQGNARNAWIRLFTGMNEGPMPAGHHSKEFSVSVPESLLPFALEDVSTKDQVRELTKRVRSAHGKTSLEDEQIQDPKVVEEKEKTPDPKPDDKRPPSDFLPDLSADAKRGSVDLVTDWATRPSDKRPTALEIQRIESKWPVFSQMMGIKPFDMLNWSIADIKELSKKFPDAIALAFLEMKHYAISNGAFKEELEALGSGNSTETKTPDKTDDKTEKTPPKKMSRLDRLRAA